MIKFLKTKNLNLTQLLKKLLKKQKKNSILSKL